MPTLQFRLQPTFPQDSSGNSIHELADHDLLVPDMGLDTDSEGNEISGDSMDEVLNKVQQRIKECFGLD